MSDIVTVPNAVLTTPARAVVAFDKKLAMLVSRMKRVLLATKNPKGVGLAAPQIGEGVQIFLTKPTAKAAIRVFINPEITMHEGGLTDRVPERDNPLEGCLSIPRIWGPVKRSASVTLRYQDEAGIAHEERFEGFLATIIQHEVDHLSGILFTQRVLEQKGKLYEPAKDKDGKEVLEEIEL